MSHHIAQVLLIDDEPEVEDLLRASLRDEPISLVAVREGAAGLAKAAQAKFDLVLLDLGLPDLNGFEVLRRFKADEHLGQSPIIVLTAWESIHDKVKGFELGATDYITKPFAVAELRVRVRATLRSKFLQDQLTEANRSLLASDQAKSAFLAIMSHEIRTPLNAMIALTGVLLEQEMPAKQRGWVETIRQSGETLLVIINDTLDFSKIEAGRLDLEARPFELETCMESVLDLFAAKAGEKRLELVSQFDPQLPAWVIGDSVRIRQILSNLIDNAIKFTDRGEVVLEAKIQSDPTPSPTNAPHPNTPAAANANPSCRLDFWVRDTGIGIPADKIDRLFKPFSQADSSTTREFGGTGLGLAICRKLIEMMGGAITLETQPQQGTTFHFHLHLPVTTPQPQSASAKTCHRLDPNLAQRLPLSVLLADDNPINQKVVLQVFQQLGYHADVAANGWEAIQAWEKQPYNLILMDVQMPRMDGLEATRKIRQIEQLRDLPKTATPIVIAMTANALTGDRERCLAAGMNDYLSKPIRPREIQGMIEKWGKARHEPAADAATPTPEPIVQIREAPTPVDSAPVDLNRMLELSDADPKNLKELVDIFLTQTDAMLQDLKSAVTAQQAPEVQRLAHKCAGSSGTCGMAKLAGFFTELEIHARKGDVSNAASLVSQAETELTNIRHFFDRYFQSPSPTDP